ncbi:hypothetical protein ZOSMA_48G00480 [Zostera marina]|uniref:Peptidase A1 domain-containing protein n=2 Tax=Zostera marina TaxID=29655 RepID=A0A0K9NZJ4_ZOSMR|nr:hypothetical protein ZOSMA_48G00480 [Zostera marina]
MDCRAVSSAMAVLVPLMMVFAHVCTANMIFQIHNKHDHLTNARMERKDYDCSSSDSGENVDVRIGSDKYPGFGIFFAKITLGDPPKAFYPEIETSTGMTWLFCNGCKTCPSKSKTFGFKINHYQVEDSYKGSALKCDDKLCMEKVGSCSDDDGSCKYKLDYGNGDMTSGNMVSDNLRMDSVIGDNQTTHKSANFVFGCGMEQTEDVASSDWASDGILGMGMSNLSLLSQLVASNLVKENTWSHCLRKDLAGGVLALGSVEMKKGIQMTPLQPHIEDYQATILDVTMAGKSLDLTGVKGASFNIFNVYTALPENMYNAVLTEIQTTYPNLNFSPTDPFSCFRYGNGTVDAIDELSFPSIFYTFQGGAQMEIHPEQYIMKRRHNEWCIQILSSGERGTLKDYVGIAENALTGRLVVYDVGNRQIGWTDYACENGIQMVDYQTGNTMLVATHEVQRQIKD